MYGLTAKHQMADLCSENRAPCEHGKVEDDASTNSEASEKFASLGGAHASETDDQGQNIFHDAVYWPRRASIF